ncbi:hypothetical protein EV384_2913 [Micromonospora kangleipakensis]|uniref:Transmembrane protein n=1 Tax=Micromonospora kangleipakensis TaxID=1077942 RepID=A0A4Q8B9M5_9ACTN|nr:hypothetical protein EV384_2913 [Micromonospora kangleipakensis]
MRNQRQVGEGLWTVLLLFWGMAMFFGVGLISAASSLGCDDECARGEDWAWLGLAISCVAGLLLMMLFVLLGWVLKRLRRRFLTFASAAMLVATVVGVVAFLSLDDGRGAPRVNAVRTGSAVQALQPTIPVVGGTIR